MSDQVCNGVREELGRFLATRPDLNIGDLTHYTTLSESTGRCFLSSNIPGGKEVVGEFRRVLDQARAGDILQPGGRQAIVVAEQPAARARRIVKHHRFYETQTVKRIAEVCAFCAESAAIGIVTAGFGCGKTESVAAWRQRSGRGIESIFYEFDEFSCANKIDFVHCLAKMFGIPVTLGSQAAGPVFRNICEHLREHPCLLIFDQCETVRARVFQIIRQIWDRTREAGVGVVILAAPLLLSRLAKSGMVDLGALTSRVGIWAPLAGVTRHEMSAIAKQEGVVEVDEAAFDLWWKATGGSMRRLMASLDLLKAKHQGKRVTEKTIAGVAGHLWGMRLPEREAA